MTIYRKMKRLIQSSVEAPMHQLVAHHDIQIFEQEISEAESTVKAAKLHLTQIKTEIRMTEVSIGNYQENISKREKQATEVLEKDTNLARDIASLIAEDERSLTSLESQLSRLRNLDSKLTQDIRKAVQTIQSHHQKLGFLKANQHNLNARNSLRSYSNGMSSSISDLNSSLRSISDRQLRTQLEDEAMYDVEQSIKDGGIDHRLEAAGINIQEKAVDQVMQRLLSDRKS